MNELTKHATERSQSRGIPPFVMNLVMDHGRRAFRDGAEVFFLDKSSRKSIRRELGRKLYARIEDQLNVYVVANDQVVTAAHRLKRMRF